MAKGYRGGGMRGGMPRGGMGMGGMNEEPVSGDDDVIDADFTEA